MRPGGTGTPELRPAHAQRLLSTAGGACAPQSRGRLGRGGGVDCGSGYLLPPALCVPRGRAVPGVVGGREGRFSPSPVRQPHPPPHPGACNRLALHFPAAAHTRGSEICGFPGGAGIKGKGVAGR